MTAQYTDLVGRQLNVGDLVTFSTSGPHGSAVRTRLGVVTRVDGKGIQVVKLIQDYRQAGSWAASAKTTFPAERFLKLDDTGLRPQLSGLVDQIRAQPVEKVRKRRAGDCNEAGTAHSVKCRFYETGECDRVGLAPISGLIDITISRLSTVTPE